MKRIAQILILFLTTSAITQNSVKTQEDQVKYLITNSFPGIFSDLELQALDIYCTNDFLLLETGEVWDMEKMRNYLKQTGDENSQIRRLNSFDFIEIKIEGKMAWVAYNNKPSLSKEEKW